LASSRRKRSEWWWLWWETLFIVGILVAVVGNRLLMRPWRESFVVVLAGKYLWLLCGCKGDFGMRACQKADATGDVCRVYTVSVAYNGFLDHRLFLPSTIHITISPLYVCPLSVCPLSVCPLSVCPLSVCPLYVCPLYVCPLLRLSTSRLSTLRLSTSRLCTFHPITRDPHPRPLPCLPPLP